MKNVRNWFSYRRKKSLRLERQRLNSSNPSTPIIKVEQDAQPPPVSPANTHAIPMENATFSPINPTNVLLLPQVQMPFPLNPSNGAQMQANYQMFLLKNFLDNVRITQGIHLLYAQLMKSQQVLSNLSMNWEVLKTISHSFDTKNN